MGFVYPDLKGRGGATEGDSHSSSLITAEREERNGLRMFAVCCAVHQRVPFLLLDEIDAHLDRARLGRLAALIREITGTNKIQSLFVTHKEKSDVLLSAHTCRPLSAGD